MKLINKSFLTAQEAESDVIAQLRSQLAPAQKQMDEYKQQYDDLKKQYETEISNLLTNKLNLTSAVLVQFDKHHNDISVFIVSPEGKGEEMHSHNSDIDIDFINRVHDDDDDDYKRMWKIGDVKSIRTTTLSSSRNETLAEYNQSFDILITLGELAKMVRSNDAVFITMQEAFLKLHSITTNIKNIETEIDELNTKINTEYTGFVKAEIERKLHAGNSIMVALFKQNSKIKHTEYPYYCMRNTKMYVIESVARTTMNVKKYEGNFEYDSKTSKDKKYPYNFLSTSYHYKPRKNIQEWIDEICRMVIQSNTILILLNTPETNKMLAVKNNKFADRSLMMEISGILDKETELYEKQNQEPRTTTND